MVPGIVLEIDFTEVRPGCYGHRYLLVWWASSGAGQKPFQQKERQPIVAKKLLEIIPRLGVPAASVQTMDEFCISGDPGTI